METQYRTIYCALCQTDISHELAVDLNGELLCTCTVCGHFIKFPQSLSLDELNQKVEEHKSENESQVIISKSYDLLNAFASQPEPTTDTPIS